MAVRVHRGPFRLEPALAAPFAEALVGEPDFFDALARLRAAVDGARGRLQARLRLEPDLAARAPLLARVPGAPTLAAGAPPADEELPPIAAALDHLLRFRPFFAELHVRAGCTRRRPDARTAAAIRDVVAAHIDLVRFGAVTAVVEATLAPDGVALAPGERIPSRSLVRFLAPAVGDAAAAAGGPPAVAGSTVRVALFVGTIGPGIDEQLDALGRREPLRALLVNALGAAAAELLAADVQLRLEADLAGPGPVRRYHVGYGDWSLMSHHALYARLDATAHLGMRLTPAGVMIPAKSVSGLMARRGARMTNP